MKKPRPRVVRAFLGDMDHELDLLNLEDQPLLETNPMAIDPSIIITRLRIRNFRGLENLDVPVGPGGAIFSGTNGEGKTTAIEAINAAAEGMGIGPEAIRIGSDKAEILLDLDKIEADRRTKLKATRTITKSKTTIALAGSDDVDLPKPKDQLAALFGGRALDPLKFYLANAKEQRAIVLAANPVRVTGEDLTKWTGESKDWNVDGHGQEVLARVRQMYFDARTKAGQDADQAKAAVTVKAQEADKLRVEKPEAMAPAAAQTHVAAAERELAVLNDRRTQAQKRDEDAAGTRTKVAEMRAKAEELMSRPEAVPITVVQLTDLLNAKLEAVGGAKIHGGAGLSSADVALELAEIALEELDKQIETVRREIDSLTTTVGLARQLESEATAAMAQANELEAAIAAEEDLSALAEQTAAAETALEDAKALVVRADATAKWARAKADVAVAESTKATADEAWTKLDAIVKKLTKDAPAELAARADLIEGLEVLPDAIMLDGKDLTLLCGAEKMRFAVSLAKRVAGKAKILTVDGLEAIAPAKQPEFVRMCLEGGWCLFATVVADGAMQVIDCYTFAKAA